MLKKIISIALILVFMFSLVGCELLNEQDDFDNTAPIEVEDPYDEF